MSLSGALGKGELAAATRERIALAVAEMNGCDYCLSAHTYLARNVAKLDDAEITANRNGASNDIKADAAVRFAVKVTAPFSLQWQSRVGSQLSMSQTRLLRRAIMDRAPSPPFTLEDAKRKVRRAEDAWNSREPDRVVPAYTPDDLWRNRAEFLQGGEAIHAFLVRKRGRELDYRLTKEIRGFRENRITVRFACEWHDAGDQWYRSHGNENWEPDVHRPKRVRLARIDDAPVSQNERRSLAGRTLTARSPVAQRCGLLRATLCPA